MPKQCRSFRTLRRECALPTFPCTRRGLKRVPSFSALWARRSLSTCFRVFVTPMHRCWSSSAGPPALASRRSSIRSSAKSSQSPVSSGPPRCGRCSYTIRKIGPISLPTGSCRTSSAPVTAVRALKASRSCAWWPALPCRGDLRSSIRRTLTPCAIPTANCPGSCCRLQTCGCSSRLLFATPTRSRGTCCTRPTNVAHQSPSS